MSPDLQLNTAKRYADAHGHELSAVPDPDLDVSGGAARRPTLEALIEQVQAGGLDGIIVARLDRFARSIINGVDAADRIHKAGGCVIAVDNGLDTSTSTGRLVMNILLSIAEHELDRFREGERAARSEIVRQGGHWGAPPLGYRRDGRTLEPDPEWAPVITELFARRAAGESVSTLAAWLDEAGARTTRGGRPTARYVRELVERRVYLGHAHAGEFENLGAHAPLVDEITWRRAQQATGPQPTKGEPTLLAGLVRCRSCRYVMGAAWSPYKDGKRRAYRCKGNHSIGRCPRPAFALEDDLLALIEPTFWRHLEQMRGRGTADNADEIRDLQRGRDEAHQAFVDYRDNVALQRGLSGEEFAGGLLARKRELDERERELHAAAAATGGGELPDVVELRAAWEAMTATDKRKLFHAVFGAVVVAPPKKRRDHTVPLSSRCAALFVEDLPADLPRPGRKGDHLREFPALDDPGTPWVALG